MTGRFLLDAAADVIDHGAGEFDDEKRQRLTALFGSRTTSRSRPPGGIYQRMIGAYPEPDRAKGQQLMTGPIESLGRGVPDALTELSARSGGH